MKYYLGADIGSVNAKLSLIDENGKILYLKNRKIIGNPKTAINSLLVELSKNFNLDQIAAAGVSGTGKATIPKEFGWAEYSSSLAIASGIIFQHPSAKTIIQIGGQSSQVIALEDGLRKPWKVASNPLCAAGTGRFLEQQAYRLGINMDDFARLALKCHDSPPRIAARCSVFAKTDLIHLQQKGVPIEMMLYALCEGIARMIASLKKGIFEESIYFVGGVATNNAIVKAINYVLSARNKYPVEVCVPENYMYMESMGSALLSRGKSSRVDIPPETATYGPGNKWLLSRLSRG
jgi:predicted CoA-substrate-specific enzyme activase